MSIVRDSKKMLCYRRKEMRGEKRLGIKGNFLQKYFIYSYKNVGVYSHIHMCSVYGSQKRA